MILRSGRVLFFTLSIDKKVLIRFTKNKFFVLGIPGYISLFDLFMMALVLLILTLQILSSMFSRGIFGLETLLSLLGNVYGNYTLFFNADLNCVTSGN